LGTLIASQAMLTWTPGRVLPQQLHPPDWCSGIRDSGNNPPKLAFRSYFSASSMSVGLVVGPLGLPSVNAIAVPLFVVWAGSSERFL
jgi:hypothetical protein